MTSTPFYLCSGFHRSGTSLVALSMVENGVDMGSTLMGPSISNANGHGEDPAVVDLHDHFLALNGTDWCYPGDYELILPANALELMKSYLSGRQQQCSGGDRGFGVKDPRAVLFLDNWYQAANGDIRFILVYRHWKFAVSSLLKRHSRNVLQSHEALIHRREDMAFWQQPELAAKMWLVAAEKMLACFSKHPDKTLLFEQSAFVDQNNTLCDIAATKGIHSAALTSNSFDPSLMQKDVPESMLDMLPDEIKARCEAVNQQLQDLADVSAPSKVATRSCHSLVETLVNTTLQGTEETVGVDQEDSTHYQREKLQFASKTPSEAIAIMKKLDRDLLPYIDWDYWLIRPGCTPTESVELFYLAVKCKQPRAAEVFLSRAVIMRDLHWQWLHLGNLYFNLGFISNAKHCYQVAFEKAPNNAGIIAKLADINTAEGKLAESKKCIEKAKAIAEDNPAIKDAQVRLDRALQKRADEAAYQKHKHTLFTPEADYQALVNAFETDKKLGRKLDRYMAQAHFILRDNVSWLEQGCEPLSEAAKRCFLDYLCHHLEQIWSTATLHNALLPYGDQPSLNNSATDNRPSVEPVVTDYQLGVHLHAEYPHAVPEILDFLKVLPATFQLVVTAAEVNQETLTEMLAQYPQCQLVIVPEGGQDVAAWLLHAAPLLSTCDLVLKLHTQARSNEKGMASWPLQLLWSLLGDASIVKRTLNAFSANPFTGLMLPPYLPAAVKHVDWEMTHHIPDLVTERVNTELRQNGPLGYFPVGRMFWYRPDALASLTSGKWLQDDFAGDDAGSESSLIEDIERIIVKVALAQGYGFHFIDVFPKVFRM
ncbi:hypothetical protein DRW07_02575 [Alteromonas sediminis]|uniref:Uncharacterized protein n=1 Tax=Alteromonas sediminis TaxID=2259342 RepID=A0A3N5YQD6_9ALTE|nr:rhamnan synthesis F family protein [Alteromonas sediminis]RPJ68311.1 hypothetical protein DRW07_02575 [Alteromonas sediminis]